jgi:Tat protein secretion system quality control protein TatD with DNase activity
MSRTYRKIIESNQNTKRRKYKKSKASWKVFREQLEIGKLHTIPISIENEV